MALTFSRWLALVAILGAASAAVILRPQSAPETAPPVLRDSLWRSTLRAGRVTRAAAQELRVLELVDSVRRARPANDTTSLLIDPLLPDFIREPLRDLARRSGVLTPTRYQPTRILILRDTRDSLRGVDVASGFNTGAYLMPTSNAEPCTIVLRVRPLSRSRFSYENWEESLEERSSAAAFGGPCAWYHVYGQPGPQVKRWLERGAWTFAKFGPVAGDSAAWRPNEFWRRIMSDDAELRFYMSLGGYRCISGDASRCADEVLFARDDEEDGSSRVRDMRIYGARERFDGLGPRQYELLAGLAREIGPERFARFWQSDEPVAEAFQRHVGQDIGNWTLSWADRNYTGRRGRGPGIAFSGALFGSSIAAAALAAALLKRRRRELA